MRYSILGYRAHARHPGLHEIHDFPTLTSAVRWCDNQISLGADQATVIDRHQLVTIYMIS